jgi:hypothetical protein
MLIYKKPEPAIYRSASTGADFKFRQSTAREAEKLEIYIAAEDRFQNNKNLYVSYRVGQSDYYAAWLLEDFSGVEDENGKPHVFANFDLASKAGLMQTLKQTDKEFAAWFEGHCEPLEKKIEEAASAEGVVGPEVLPAVQGQQRG